MIVKDTILNKTYSKYFSDVFFILYDFCLKTYGLYCGQFCCFEKIE